MDDTTLVGLVCKRADPGRFDLPSSDYTPEISRFKSENADIVFTVIPGPDFTIFWNQCAEQGFKPKIVSAGKVGEFPQGVYPYGVRAINFACEVWWPSFTGELVVVSILPPGQ